MAIGYNPRFYVTKVLIEDRKLHEDEGLKHEEVKVTVILGSSRDTSRITNDEVALRVMAAINNDSWDNPFIIKCPPSAS